MIVGVLSFPIGTLMAWHAYRDVVRFENRCLYDKVDRKIKNDCIVMIGLIAVWITVIVILTNSAHEVPGQ
jgi:hypothetical protein